MASRAAAGSAQPGQPDTSEMQARMLEDACRTRIQDNMREVRSNTVETTPFMSNLAQLPRRCQ